MCHVRLGLKAYANTSQGPSPHSIFRYKRRPMSIPSPRKFPFLRVAAVQTASSHYKVPRKHMSLKGSASGPLQSYTCLFFFFNSWEEIVRWRKRICFYRRHGPKLMEPLDISWKGLTWHFGELGPHFPKVRRSFFFFSSYLLQGRFYRSVHPERHQRWEPLEFYRVSIHSLHFFSHHRWLAIIYCILSSFCSTSFFFPC